MMLNSTLRQLIWVSVYFRMGQKLIHFLGKYTLACSLYFEIPNPPVSTPHLSPFVTQITGEVIHVLVIIFAHWLYFISVSGQK